MYKLIIAVIGYLLFGLLGAFLGFLTGSAVDRARQFGLGAMNPLSNSQRKAVFLETAFVLMGRLAKADGHISKDEIAHAEAFIQKMGLSSEHRQIAIAQFKRGSAADFDIRPQIEHFMAVCGHTLHLRQMLLLYLIIMALADGRLDHAEQHLLVDIAAQLGYTRSEFERMLNMISSQTHFSHSDTPPSSSALEEAYQALGVSKDSSDQEIKRAYRKLISQYHPDKLMGQGLPEDMIAVATEQAKEIQLAYDLIKKQRQIH